MHLMWLKQIEKCIALQSVEAVTSHYGCSPHEFTMRIYNTPMSSSSTVVSCVCCQFHSCSDCSRFSLLTPVTFLTVPVLDAGCEFDDDYLMP